MLRFDQGAIELFFEAGSFAIRSMTVRQGSVWFSDFSSSLFERTQQGEICSYGLLDADYDRSNLLPHARGVTVIGNAFSSGDREPCVSVDWYEWEDAD